MNEDGELYYYVNGVRFYAGLIQIDGDYYYVNSSCKVVTNQRYWVSKTNDLLPAGFYNFDADGKMTDAPIPTPDPDPDPNPDPEVKNGIVNEDGELYYYVNGVKTYAGLIQIDDDYYYVNSYCKVIVNQRYWVSKTNDLLPAGFYNFDVDGKMTDMVYTIYEQPVLAKPVLENPVLENPTSDNPTSDNPASGNPTQLNKEIQRTNLPRKEKLNTDGQSTDSIPFPSLTPAPVEDEAAAAPPERKGTGKDAAVQIYREILLENIEYDYLIQDSSIDREQLDEIVDLMLETVCTSRKTIRIAGDDYPAELVKSKFMKLNSEHIRFVFDCLRENTTKVRNIKQYLRAMLFNAPSTISNYYTSLVAHDMAQPDWGKPKSGLPDYSCSPDESL